jgi:hypothetical protein
VPADELGPGVLRREVAATVREGEEPYDVERTGQGGEREHRVTQETLTQREDDAHHRALGTREHQAALMTLVARCGHAYSRTGSLSWIGVVGACRLRSGHLKALPVVSRLLF